MPVEPLRTRTLREVKSRVQSHSGKWQGRLPDAGAARSRCTWQEAEGADGSVCNSGSHA